MLHVSHSYATKDKVATAFVEKLGWHSTIEKDVEYDARLNYTRRRRVRSLWTRCCVRDVQGSIGISLCILGKTRYCCCTMSFSVSLMGKSNLGWVVIMLGIKLGQFSWSLGLKWIFGWVKGNGLLGMFLAEAIEVGRFWKKKWIWFCN